MSDRRSILQESLAAIDHLQSRVDAMEASRHEPIAIVSMACRFPGDVETPEALWALLRDGIDAVGDVPGDRWDVEAMDDGNPQAPRTMATRQGGFLRQVDQFDPAFFGISPREASTLDPQQRLLLETATEVFERAGIATDSLQASATGVFIGITSSDYGQLTRGGGPQQADIYAATGNALNAAAGRIAFTFGLQGPCMSLDTACSSSLVAVHLACQSLRAGESQMALAGGVNVVLSPEAMELFSKWGMLAPDGRCKTFDAAADGFVRAEGCAMVALKRLSDAVAAGDPILAVIRGSAVNSDGRSSGLTVPSGPAQEALLRTALQAAQLLPTDIDYVEAHGTGTPLGDPIEVEALARVVGAGRDAANPLLVGSLKTNLGHTESASGLAGLMKVVLSLQHDAIAPHLHLKEPNPRIDWARLPLAIPTELTPWVRGSRPRRAGVSSFGFSGTNAHVIVEEAPSLPTAALTSDVAPAAPARDAEQLPHLITLSGHTAPAVRALAARYQHHVDTTPDLSLRDLAFTLGHGRKHLRQRCAFVARDRAELLRTLAEVASGDGATGVAAHGQIGVGERPRIAFVFTGQGSQYAGMGRALYDTEPVFRDVIDRADALLATHLEHRLTTVMFDAGGLLNETRYAQPALFALEMALVALWRSWGVSPSAVIGHSVGEYAAACTAGVFSFEDGLTLIAERGRLMQELPAGGRMAAVFCTPERLAPYIDRAPAALSIAARNGPEETVLSGDAEAVEQVLAALAVEGVRGQLLTVSHAFHSPRLEPMLAPFELRAAAIAYAAPQLPMVSNVTGALFESGAAPDAAYWRTHARGTVQFADGLRALHALGPTMLIEIGPHPTLLSLAAAGVPEATWTLAPTLRRGEDPRSVALNALGRAYTRGVSIAWPAFSAADHPQRIVLPTYAFQRERHWVAPGAVVSGGGAHRTAHAGHPLLGVGRELAAPVLAQVWERELSLDRLPWLTDHRVQGDVILPATAYIEMAIAVGHEAFEGGPTTITQIENLKPLILRDGETRIVQTALTPRDGLPAHFAVHSRSVDARGRGLGPWTAHMSAEVRRDAATEASSGGAAVVEIEAMKADCTEVIEGAAFYAALARHGNQWGPSFQGVQRIWRRRGEVLAQIRVPEQLAADTDLYRFHPAVADACGQVLGAIGPLSEAVGSRKGAFVGAGVGTARFHRSPSGTLLWVVARQKPSPDEAKGIVLGDILVYNDDGTLVGETLDARLWYLDGQAQVDVFGAPTDWLYTPTWEGRARGVASARVAAAGPWVILADNDGIAEALAARRRASGERTILVRAGRAFSLLDDDATIRVGEAADYVELMRQVGSCSAVVHLWRGNASARDSTVPAGDWHAALSFGPEALLHLLHALSDDAVPRHAQRPRVWLVTAGAQAALPSDETPQPAAAMLWGIGRTFAAEHGELWGGLVDLDPKQAPESLAAFLADEVMGADADDRIACRDGQRFVARLIRRPRDVERRDTLPACAGTVLVTGGLGGIGLAMARWFVQRGARQVVLLGRRGLPAREEWSAVEVESVVGQRIAAVRAIEAMGAEVEVAAVDVADRDAVAAMLEARGARGASPVRGVIHAAGVLTFDALDSQAATGLDADIAGKVGGAFNLHELLSAEPLDFFIMCSSSSALLASPRLGVYAAGNAYLDALAWHRHARGQAALCINWGTWGEVGMAVDAAHGGGLLAGMQAMETDRALAAMEALLTNGDVQAAVMPVDWASLSAAYPAFAADPFLEQLVESGGAAPSDASTALSHSIRMREAPASELPLLLRRHLQQVVGRLLGIAADEIESDSPLSSMGFDSLMAVQLKNGLESGLGIVVPMMRLLQGPSVDELVPLLADALDRTPAPAAVAVGDSDDEWEEGTL